MGIRPNKIIGWGSTSLKTEFLNKKEVLDIQNKYYNSKDTFYNYSNFKKYAIEELKKQNYPIDKSFLEISNENNLSPKRNISNRLKVIDFKYEDERKWEKKKYFFNVSPLPVSSLFLSKNNEILDKEWNEGDTAFVYAELERFFPKSLKTLDTYSYNFQTAIFPTTYNLYKKESNNFVVVDETTDRFKFEAIKKILSSKIYKEETPELYLEILSKTYDLNEEDVYKDYILGPPLETVIFTKWLNIFKNDNIILDLKPTVTYYWN